LFHELDHLRGVDRHVPRSAALTVDFDRYGNRRLTIRPCLHDRSCGSVIDDVRFGWKFEQKHNDKPRHSS